MAATEDLFRSLIRASRALLSTGCATSLAALIALPLLASAQAPVSSPRDRFSAGQTANEPEADLETDFVEVLAPTPPQEPLDWTPNPGAFEQELRRRVSNPLYPVERQVVRPAELKAAKIRDASDARAVLSEFVDLSLDRRKLAWVKTGEEIELALARYQTVRLAVIGVGGEALSLVGGLNLSRAALIEQWRVAHRDHPEILAALDSVAESDALGDSAAHNEFAAQLQREDGPILADELAPALLSETPDTIEVVLATLSPKQRSAFRIQALDLISSLQGLGVAIEDEQAKVDLLLTHD